MATSAFKSTTKRTPISTSQSSTTDDSASSTSRNSSAHRRSRSLSRFSRRLPGQDFFPDEAPKGKFVNTVRGSAFPEINLDDLAIEFFDSSGDRGRLASRNGDISPKKESRVGGSGGTSRRGRSVSRQGAKSTGSNISGGGRVVPASNDNMRRRRSVSVSRYQISDSESDLDRSQSSSNHASLKSNISVNSQMPSFHRSTASNRRPMLRRSLSQRDLKHHDGYSSQSSALTDDEGRDSKNGIEKIIQAVYARNKGEHPTGDDSNCGLYYAMRKELRHAVEEIRTEIEQAAVKIKTSPLPNDNSLQSKNYDALQPVSAVRKNYATKLEQSEKRKQELLAEILLEEQHSMELSNIVQDLLPKSKNSVEERPTRARKRSNDRHRMSKRLTEEAEKYIEDFISNVEDTDISSIDGERSDTSSTLGGVTKTQTFQSPKISKPLPVQMDGVVLPWLQWETTNDASFHSCKTKTRPLSTPETKFWDSSQEPTTAQDITYHSASSHGTWSPGIIDGYYSMKFGEKEGNQNQKTRSYIDVNEYLKFHKDEDLLFEMLRQQQRINSGGLLLCKQMFL